MYMCRQYVSIDPTQIDTNHILRSRAGGAFQSRFSEKRVSDSRVTRL